MSFRLPICSGRPWSASRRWRSARSQLRFLLHAPKVGQGNGQALHFRIARQERLHPGERHGVDLAEQAGVFRLREIEPGVENGHRLPARFLRELDLPEAFAKAVVREAEIEASGKIVMHFVSVEFPLDERDLRERRRAPRGFGTRGTRRRRSTAGSSSPASGGSRRTPYDPLGRRVNSIDWNARTGASGDGAIFSATSGREIGASCGRRGSTEKRRK